MPCSGALPDPEYGPPRQNRHIKGLKIASEICVYTNDTITVEECKVKEMSYFTPKEIVAELR